MEAELKPLSQNIIFIWPELASHCFIDDGYLRRLRPVVFVEAPPLAKRNAHRLEIIRADLPVEGAVPGRRSLASFSSDTAASPFPDQRRRRCVGGGGHSGYRSDELQRLLIKSSPLGNLSVFAAWEIGSHRQDVLRTKTRIEVS